MAADRHDLAARLPASSTIAIPLSRFSRLAAWHLLPESRVTDNRGDVVPVVHSLGGTR